MKILVFFLILFMFIAVSLSQEPGRSKTLVLEAAKIEGKIKKPQVALISLERRPVFKPIALSNQDVRKDILESIDKNVFESRTYLSPFDVGETGREP